MTHFHINERADRDLTILDLAGRLRNDHGNILLENALRRLVGQGQNQIILNFSRVSYIDGIGVRELIKGFNTISNAGGQLKICRVKSRSLELIPLTELSMVFELFEREKDATESFKIRRNYFKTSHGGDNLMPGLEAIVINTKMRTFFSQIIMRDNRSAT